MKPRFGAIIVDAVLECQEKLCFQRIEDVSDDDFIELHVHDWRDWYESVPWTLRVGSGRYIESVLSTDLPFLLDDAAVCPHVERQAN